MYNAHECADIRVNSYMNVACNQEFIAQAGHDCIHIAMLCVCTIA